MPSAPYVSLEALHAHAQLAARPSVDVRPATQAVPLRFGDQTIAGATVHVPEGYRADRPAGLLVMLHGAGGDARQALSFVRATADRSNVIVVAPKSAGSTWDFLERRFGPDVARLDTALEAVFTAYAVDPERVAIGGFSDGASYALTLGLANGRLFRSIVALSPGFQGAPRPTGMPRLFVAHGTHDRVLPIDRTSRQLVPSLRRAGYDVEYVEFDGGHEVPPNVLGRALAWWRRGWVSG